MISTNLNISTCSVENEIKAPSTPNDLRIDIRTVSEFHFLLDFPLFSAKNLVHYLVIFGGTYVSSEVLKRFNQLSQDELEFSFGQFTPVQGRDSAEQDIYFHSPDS